MSRVAVAAAVSWLASQANPASASGAKTEEEVIVEVERIELERKVYDFVCGIAERGYMTESLARWNKPICSLSPFPNAGIETTARQRVKGFVAR